MPAEPLFVPGFLLGNWGVCKVVVSVVGLTPGFVAVAVEHTDSDKVGFLDTTLCLPVDRTAEVAVGLRYLQS